MIRTFTAPSIAARRLALFAAFGLSLSALAQTPAPPADAPAPPLPPPHGTVLFERHAETPAPAEAQPQAAPQPPPATSLPIATPGGSALTDAERAAITVTAYDLDARIVPATAQLLMRARLTLRNDGTAPLPRIALQISSTLAWQSATLLTFNGQAAQTRLLLVQHLLDTDTDHTGKSNELVLELPQPLATGQTLILDTLYAGTIKAGAERLERIGAGQDPALAADWDAIAPEATALRGFGNVLWFPVASPQYFLGDGAKLFQAIGQSRLREQDATVRLRLALEYHGDAPTAAYFCGRRQPFSAVSDDSDAPVASGIATAEFPAERLGFRPLSLFVADRRESRLVPLSANTSSNNVAGNIASDSEDLLAVETLDEPALPRLADSARSLVPLLQQWFGVHPLSALTVIDLPQSSLQHEFQPFEDGPLLVAPVASLGSSTAAPALAHSLTHAWVQTGQPWMDEGLAQFVALLTTEQEQGRESANAALRDLMRPVVLAAPAPDSLAGDTGQPLIHTGDELYYRRKAAAVWWMLRSLVGDQALQIALTTWRTQPVSHDPAETQAVAFEHLLEKVSRRDRKDENGKDLDLAWFFHDWVLHDRGLPDLTIVDVTPRLLASGKGHDSGWLVAVTVRNDGAATAEVPLVIRSGDFSVTKSIRVPGLGSATERVVTEAKPTQVVVNDGSVPELRDWQHSIAVNIQTQP